METPNLHTPPDTTNAEGVDVDPQSIAARAVGTLAHVVAVFRGGAEQAGPEEPQPSPYERAFAVAAGAGRIATELARLATEPLSAEAARRKQDLVDAAHRSATQLRGITQATANHFPHDPEDPSTRANVFAVAFNACVGLVRTGHTSLARLIASSDPELQKSIEALTEKDQK